MLTLVGVINLPVIKFSVECWNTLHQPASVLRLGSPALDRTFLIPLLVMTSRFTLLFVSRRWPRCVTKFCDGVCTPFK